MELVSSEASVGDDDVAAGEECAGPSALKHRRGDLAVVSAVS
jgi:hypothetical protein